jgi:dienelactone hydrolase
VKRWTVGLVAVAALALGACGDSDIEWNPKPKDSHHSGGAVVEWGKPTGDPTGVVILLPGGGWARPSRTTFDDYKQQALAIQAGGIATAVVRYDAGAQALGQIEGVYAKAQERFPGVPICLIGGSAGAHWALMLAAREPEISCVVDQAGPTDLTKLAEQGSQEGHELAVTAFGAGRLAKFSPVRYEITTPVLGIYAESDQLVPVEQGEELARALPNAELIKLPDGSTPGFHSGVDGDALVNANARIAEFLQQWMASAP